MTPQIDIFRVEQAGLLWIEAATTLKDAERRVQQLATRSPGEYLLVNLMTGNKLTMKVDSPGGANA